MNADVFYFLGEENDFQDSLSGEFTYNTDAKEEYYYQELNDVLPKYDEDDSTYNDLDKVKSMREELFLHEYKKKTTVLSYENWEGKILQVHSNKILARIINTQSKYASRIVEINRSLFAKNNYVDGLEVGEKFELCFKKIQNANRQIIKTESIRKIVQIQRAPEQIQDIIDKTLNDLSFLFK